MNPEVLNPTVRYQNEVLLVIDKPAGLVVHDGAGQEEQWLLTDWLKQEQPDIIKAFADEPTDPYFRPGIVHRLDKNTSGLLIIAKTPLIRDQLQAQFKDRAVTKEYATLVLGQPNPEEGSINTFIRRNPAQKREMAVSLNGQGKEARTDYKTVQTWQYNKTMVSFSACKNCRLKPNSLEILRLGLVW